jgi:uncharacterized membrane protein
MQRVERFVEIDAPVELVFDRFSDFESFPRWMRGVRAVRRTGRGRTRWVRETATPDVYAEWEAELTVFEPDHRVVWRSVRGDIRADGEAVVSETREGTTLLHVVVGFGTPLGRSGAGAARFYGGNPGRQLEEDLERFGRLVEREGRQRRRQASGSAARRASFAPVMSRREELRRGAEDERRPTQAPPRAREEAREEFLRRDEGAAPRREDRAPRRAETTARGRESEWSDYSPRHSLTPRERERDRDEYERRFDPGVSEMFGRRGVDRLLDGRRDGRRRGDGDGRSRE